jgi:hypothetical protein
MTPINARLANVRRLRERLDPGRRRASRSWPFDGYITMEIDRVTAEELNEAIRPSCSAFIAKVWLRQRARTA